jgi:cytochrome c oxidase subunit II
MRMMKALSQTVFGGQMNLGRGLKSWLDLCLKLGLGLILATGLMGPVAALAGDAAGTAPLKDGQPTDGAMAWQPPASIGKVEANHFYNDLLFPIIAGIVALVFVLLLIIIVRFNKRANPIPAKFSHNTLIEIIWTLGPIVILVIIAVQSFHLLRTMNEMPKPDLVIKASGNQWYWTYDYPELGITDRESRLLPDAADLKKSKAANIPYLLEVDNPLVVPVGKVVHVETTSTDVIHSFAMPSFNIKMDAVPGRLNHTWFRADHEGTFYGQCSELCGVDHAFMPIEIKVVSEGEFETFVAKNGGKLPGAAPAVAATSSSSSSSASVPGLAAIASSSSAKPMASASSAASVAASH